MGYLKNKKHRLVLFLIVYTLYGLKSILYYIL